MLSFFLTRVEDEWGVSYTPTIPGYISLAVIIAVLLILAVSLTKKGEKKKSFDAKQLVFCAMAIAIATVTSMIKLYEFPFGGSVTLISMFFICFVGYLYGPAAGIMTGLAHGVLQLLIDPYILFPMQVLVDYILAFGALGLSGLFWKSRNGLYKGYILGILGRYAFVVLSGWLFFGEYAWEGWDPLPYSLAYNGAYIFAEAAITLILLIAVKPLRNGLDYVKRMTQN
ncbi:energy-coupled thiamine transporter ThiT [Acetivibrio ethanolgignens]|uniref:Proton-coupled thiamine transporter YuaJ n=1 Tax=Acetivibrio ethanolgignens TaxID=290052 RepID=A0A0V8QH43_9FIRM|nr:energy-coupled thiamine transporter ThiT [Acetivibrio ethanolgignens]KSV59804.1 proton-coupled thiamine transporter YuaJ [Acetivibrio ethanolgignens]